MSGFNKARNSFPDVKEIFERALNSSKGIAVECRSRSEAITLRSRLNYFRKRNRKDNCTIYPAEHVMYNNSIYDKFVIRIPEKDQPDSTSVFIELRSIEGLTVRDLE